MQRSKRLKVCVAVTLVVGCLTRPVSAFLGIGDIVFDPSAYAQIVEQLRQMEQQYDQLVRTYQMVRNQYDHMLTMAQQVPVNMSLRYRALTAPWRLTTATNTYGTTGRWLDGINSGSAVRTGYTEATLPLERYGAELGAIPAEQLRRLQVQYGTVEITDGANVAAMQTIGAIRSNAEAVERVLQNLENDSLSAAAAMNTEVAILNKLNAGQMIALRTAQDSNKVLVALAEQQIAQSKRVRDAETQAINNHIRFRRNGQAVMAAQAAGASDAMRAWRMR